MVTPAQCVKKYGKATRATEGKYMVVWDVPDDLNRALPTVPNRLYCNRDLIGPLERALRNVVERGLADQLKTWDGCYNLRTQRGASVQSLHSWGIAIDINAAWNQLGQKSSLTPEFVACFTDAGFDWGGWFKRPDAMHMQLAALPS